MDRLALVGHVRLVLVVHVLLLLLLLLLALLVLLVLILVVLLVLLILVLVLLVLVLVLLVRVPVVVHLRAVLTCKTKWQCVGRARPLGGRWSRRSRTFAVAILFLQPIIIRYLTVVADRVQ